MKQAELTIVNRHYPPNINITGENAWDLANYLIQTHHIDVTIVHIDRSYEGGGNKREPVGRIIPVKTIYEGTNKIIRYLAGIIDGYKLIRTALKRGSGPIIVMTSPPLLPMWASRMITKKREWILWSMDLFPEGFAATGEISSNNFLYKYAFKQTYKNAPAKIIALGPQQKKELDRKYGKEIPYTLLPCGVFNDQDKSETIPSWKKEPSKIYFGYCGNCGNPHSEDFIKYSINAIDPQKHHFILAVYGVKAPDILQYAQGKPGVTILSSVPRNELHHIDVHLVTLVNSWTHVAVPSKAVSSICSGASILFCGSKESDNWVLLKDAGWLIEDDQQLKENTQKRISAITKEELLEKKQNAVVIYKQLKETLSISYNTIASWAK